MYPHMSHIVFFLISLGKCSFIRHAWTIWVAIGLQKFGWTGLGICSCCVPTYLGGLWLGDEVCTTSSISWWFLMILHVSWWLSPWRQCQSNRGCFIFFFGHPWLAASKPQIWTTCVFWARWGGKHVKTRSTKSNKNWYSWRIFAIKGGVKTSRTPKKLNLLIIIHSSPNFWLMKIHFLLGETWNPLTPSSILKGVIPSHELDKRLLLILLMEGMGLLLATGISSLNLENTFPTCQKCQ